MFGKINKPEFRTSSKWDDVSLEWAAVLPKGHHLLGSDLKALEQSAPEDISFKYVSVYIEGQLEGLFYLQSLKFNKRHYRYDSEGNIFLQSIRKCLSSQEADLLICGNLFRVNFQGYYFKDARNRDLIFSLLLSYRKQVASEISHCGILLKDCESEYGNSICSLQKFKPFRQDLTMELHIRPHWKIMDHYLSDLSRKYRQRASKIIKSLEGLTVREMLAEELEMRAEALETLYLNIVDKQSISPGILNAAYFVHMKKQLGDRFRVNGYFKDNELVAFSSYIYYPPQNRMEIHYIGLSYSHNKQYNLYFNILFDGIRNAIESGFNAIEMGRTAREAKASAGAVAVENHNYIWLQAGLIRLVFNMMSNWYNKNIGEDWKSRDPFKTTPQTQAIVPEDQIPVPVHSV